MATQVHQPAPPAGLPFILTPAQQDNLPLDFSIPAHCKILRAMEEALPTVFDGSAKNFQLFLDEISDKARRSNWLPILRIPDDNLIVRDLLEEYGRLSLSNVRAHAVSYMTTQQRLAQNSLAMHTCLSKSLTAELRQRLLGKRGEFVVSGVADGPSYLKVIISAVVIDTAATTMHIRDQLGRLHEYLHTNACGMNITKFNQHVRHLLLELEARGETSTDTLNHLLRGYRAATNQAFIQYIDTKQHRIEEGEHLDYKVLMLHAENFYKARVQEGVWGAPSKGEEKLLALSTQISELQAKNDTLLTRLSKGKKKKGNGNGKGKGKGKGKKKKDDGKGSEKKKFAEWRYKRDGKSGPIQKDGRTWHWCQHHGAWMGHSSDECFKAKSESQGDAGKKSTPSALQLSKALSTIIEVGDE
jgi:hypothetical protein